MTRIRKDSEGARLLRELPLRVFEIERRIGVGGDGGGGGRGMVTHWRYGDSKPSRKWAAVLHREFGIDPAAWDLPPQPTTEQGKTGTEG
jgi:hypothetical protein